MKKKLVIITAALVLVSLLLPGALLAAAKKPAPPPDYFPLGVGYWWTYKNVEKGWECTLKVTGVETIGTTKCYKVETTAGNGQVMFVDYYAKAPGKVIYVKQVYPNAKQEITFSPDRVYLSNPMKVGDSVSWKGKGMMDVDIDELSKVTAMTEVKVPAGKFGVANVESTINQGGTEIKKSYWYAPNIGMVKSFTDSGSMKSTLELVKYNVKPAK